MDRSVLCVGFTFSFEFAIFHTYISLKLVSCYGY